MIQSFMENFTNLMLLLDGPRIIRINYNKVITVKLTFLFKATFSMILNSVQIIL